MDLQEAIDVALEFERKVRDQYLRSADGIPDPRGRRVFATLAKEEQRHVDYLTLCLAQWRKTGKVPDVPLKSAFPQGVEWIEEAKARLEGRQDRRSATKTELDALETALRHEKETDAFYHKLVAGLRKDEQALFEKFLGIEDRHLALVQAQLDAVRDRGFWFDVSAFIGDG